MTSQADAHDILTALGEHVPGTNVYALDRDYRYTYFNTRHAGIMLALWGERPGLGVCLLDLLPDASERERTRRSLDRALAGEVFSLIEVFGDEDDPGYWELMYAPVLAGDDEVSGVLVQVTDITARARAEAEAQRQHERLERLVAERSAELAEKAALIQSLTAPILRVWDGVLVVPLAGELDQYKATQAIGDVLAEIQRQRARELLVDITGLRSVDADAAAHLAGMARAVGLLGARCAVVGVRPEIAEALVDLDLSLGAATFGTLHDGLRAALVRMQQQRR